MRPPYWSPAEAAHIEALAGDHPFPELVKLFQRRARREGWPVRSEKAIALRMLRVGLRGRARDGACTTTYGAAELLGVSGECVVAWLRNAEIHQILAPRAPGRIRYIERAAWRRLARQRPDVFGGIPADRLFLLLEDRELADQVAAAHPIGRADWRVRCVETGKVWSNCKAAGAELCVAHDTISRAMREGRPVAVLGLRFEALRRVR